MKRRQLTRGCVYTNGKLYRLLLGESKTIDGVEMVQYQKVAIGYKTKEIVSVGQYTIYQITRAGFLAWALSYDYTIEQFKELRK